MSFTMKEVRELRTGAYIVIDDEPCRIVEMSISKPGKHGDAKARIVAIGLFDGQKRSIVAPVKDKVKVPIVDKRQGQVIAIMGDTVQIMDLDTYETLELPIPDDPEIRERLQPGKEVQYIVSMGKAKITRA
ncbi:MAG TPA: translation initiation factor IF-5A [Thermoprotei archaeon]|nr:translation initiation factor IF-5A [Euryarchaeota archaeon]MCD6158375.1 translation initiation factor IF-5A [Euryarchaeota archaeon]HDJ51155.1 translation initiation factor IF-5A [Thermoprotei archaeon]